MTGMVLAPLMVPVELQRLPARGQAESGLRFFRLAVGLDAGGAGLRLRSPLPAELCEGPLRARFHLLGLCTLAVESADRFGQPTAGGPGAPAGKVGPTDASVCGELRPGDTLRHAQRRLLASLLSAWRVKYPEPMTDLVVALANFASRDNPVVDGPRAAR